MYKVERAIIMAAGLGKRVEAGKANNGWETG